MGMLVLKIWLLGFAIYFVIVSGIFIKGWFTPDNQKLYEGATRQELIEVWLSYLAMTTVAAGFWFLSILFYMYLSVRELWIWRRCPRGE